MARVMRDVADRTTPSSIALTLEANVHCKTASSILARQRETIVDTEHFKGFEKVRPLQTFTLVNGISSHIKSSGLIWAFEAMICASSMLEIAQWAGEARLQSCV